jgi:hypothetical protein
VQESVAEIATHFAIDDPPQLYAPPETKLGDGS